MTAPRLSPAESACADRLVRAALTEDLGPRGDVTTDLFVPRDARVSGRIVAKGSGVVCGTTIAAEVFRAVDRNCKIRVVTPDGRRVKPGRVVMRVSGGRGILTAERTALNFLQRLSGISTVTALYCERASGTRARVYDTRKTLPGWRALEKYAVRCGGGQNHRMGLFDAALVKDNHWASGDVPAGVRRLRRLHPGLPLEIEASDLAQVEAALELRADVILLDNMPAARLREAIALVRRLSKRTEIEISGGVSLDTVGGLAKLGPDRISIGRLTHSAQALDLSLEIP